MVKYFIKNITKLSIKKNYINAIIYSENSFKIINLNSSLLLVAICLRITCSMHVLYAKRACILLIQYERKQQQLSTN